MPKYTYTPKSALSKQQDLTGTGDSSLDFELADINNKAFADTPKQGNWDSFKEFIQTPLTSVGHKVGQAVARPLTDWGMNKAAEYPIASKIAIGAGALGENFGDVADAATSPLNIGLTAGTMGAGAIGSGGGKLAQALETPGRILGASQVGHGAYKVATGKDWEEKAGGGVEALLGALGIRSNIHPGSEAGSEYAAGAEARAMGARAAVEEGTFVPRTEVNAPVETPVSPYSYTPQARSVAKPVDKAVSKEALAKQVAVGKEKNALNELFGKALDKKGERIALTEDKLNSEFGPAVEAKNAEMDASRDSAIKGLIEARDTDTNRLSNQNATKQISRDQKNLADVEKWLVNKRKAEAAAREIDLRKNSLVPTEPTVSETIKAPSKLGTESSTQRWMKPAEEDVPVDEVPSDSTPLPKEGESGGSFINMEGPGASLGLNLGREAPPSTPASSQPGLVAALASLGKGKAIPPPAPTPNLPGKPPVAHLVKKLLGMLGGQKNIPGEGPLNLGREAPTYGPFMNTEPPAPGTKELGPLNLGRGETSSYLDELSRMSPEELNKIATPGKLEDTGIPSLGGMTTPIFPDTLPSRELSLEDAGTAYGHLQELFKSGRIPNAEARSAGKDAFRLAQAANKNKPPTEVPSVTTPPTGEPTNGLGNFEPGYENDLQDLASLNPEQRGRAIKAIVRNEKGAIDPMLMARVAGGLGGAALGAESGDDTASKIRRGVGFGVAGALAPGIAKALYEDPTAALWKGVEYLPKIQRANLLTSMKGLPTNAAGGPAGALFFDALERMGSGDARGGEILKKLFNVPELVGRIPKAYKEAGGKIGRAEGDPVKPGGPLFDRVTRIPGTALTTGDEVGKSIFHDVGVPEQEALDATLTSEPFSKLGKSISNIGRGSPIGQTIMPFARTKVNWIEQGLRRLPGVGEAVQRMTALNGGYPMDPARQRIAQQAIGAATMAGTGALGDNVDPETAAALAPIVSNLGGRYGLAGVLGLAGGAALRAGSTVPEAIGKALTKGATEFPLPTTSPLVDLFKWGSSGLDPEQVPRSFIPGLLNKDLDTVINKIETRSPSSPTQSPAPSGGARRTYTIRGR